MAFLAVHLALTLFPSLVTDANTVTHIREENVLLKQQRNTHCVLLSMYYWVSWILSVYYSIKKRNSVTILTLLTPNICLRSGSRKRKGMFETWSRFGVPLASEESPADPPAPAPPALHCTPASPWDVSSGFPCGSERPKAHLRSVGSSVPLHFHQFLCSSAVFIWLNTMTSAAGFSKVSTGRWRNSVCVCEFMPLTGFKNTHYNLIYIFIWV